MHGYSRIFAYPFIHWRAPGLFLLWGHVEQCCYEHFCKNLRVDNCFASLWYCLRSRTAGCCHWDRIEASMAAKCPTIQGTAPHNQGSSCPEGSHVWHSARERVGRFHVLCICRFRSWSLISVCPFRFPLSGERRPCHPYWPHGGLTDSGKHHEIPHLMILWCPCTWGHADEAQGSLSSFGVGTPSPAWFTLRSLFSPLET